eukprot:768610-Hanusia_phi.AAC.3
MARNIARFHSSLPSSPSSSRSGTYKTYTRDEESKEDETGTASELLSGLLLEEKQALSEVKAQVLLEVLSATTAILPCTRKVGLVISKGPNLQVVLANETLKTLLDWPKSKDDCPQTIHDILPPQIRRVHQQWVTKAIEQGNLPGSLLHPLRNVSLQKASGGSVQANVILRTLGGDVDLGSDDCMIYSLILPVDDDGHCESPHNQSGLVSSAGLWHLAAEVLYGSSAGRIVAAGQLPEPESYSLATVLFLDIVGYTKRCMELSPDEITDWMSHGDGDHDQMTRMVKFAVAVFHRIKANNDTLVRVGIACGPLTIAYIDSNHFAPTMCAFGDTMNTAARMEQSGIPGLLHLSEEAALRYLNERWSQREEGGMEGETSSSATGLTCGVNWDRMDIKGKGTLRTAWIDCETGGFEKVQDRVKRELQLCDEGSEGKRTKGGGDLCDSKHEDSPRTSEFVDPWACQLLGNDER